MNIKHGMSGTPEYIAWKNMRARCHNPNNTSYERYGGRGITVCDEWNKNFDAFFGDMGKRPSKNHSVERIDNTKGYFKENCSWATAKEQARNRRTSLILTMEGQSKTLAQWADDNQIKLGTLWHRIKVAGLSLEAALSK